MRKPGGGCHFNIECSLNYLKEGLELASSEGEV